MSSLRFLAAAPKSRSALGKKLLEKGYGPGVVQATLDELERQGILNDRAYAENVAARKAQGSLAGRRMIRFELKRRGIPAKIQEEVLLNLSPGDEAVRARELARQRRPRLKNLDPAKRKKKLYDLLLRRGFEYETIREVVAEIEGESE